MTHHHRDLTFILDELVRVPDVVHALVFSADGLVTQMSTTLPRDAADQMAAASSALYSLAGRLGVVFDSGPVSQACVEYQKHMLFIAAAGQNTRLAVLCKPTVDMGSIAYEMGTMVTRIGDYLGSATRASTLVEAQPRRRHA